MQLHLLFRGLPGTSLARYFNGPFLQLSKEPIESPDKQGENVTTYSQVNWVRWAMNCFTLDKLSLVLLCSALDAMCPYYVVLFLGKVSVLM